MPPPAPAPPAAAPSRSRPRPLARAHGAASRAALTWRGSVRRGGGGPRGPGQVRPQGGRRARRETALPFRLGGSRRHLPPRRALAPALLSRKHPPRGTGAQAPPPLPGTRAAWPSPRRGVPNADPGPSPPGRPQGCRGAGTRSSRLASPCPAAPSPLAQPPRWRSCPRPGPSSGRRAWRTPDLRPPTSQPLDWAGFLELGVPGPSSPHRAQSLNP